MNALSRRELLHQLSKDKLIESSEAEKWSALNNENFLEVVLQTIQREGTIPLDQNTTSTKRSKVWNTIAVWLANSRRLDDAIRVWESMLGVGSDNPATLSNYGSFLLLRDPMRGSSLIAQAYDKDCVRPSGEALLLPAFRNLSLALLVQARIFHKAGDRFISLILGWQSIEYRLRSVWMQFLNDRNLSRKFQKDLLRWDISKIIWALNFMEILDDPIRSSIMEAGRLRNRVLHARGQIPTLDEIDQKIIQTAQDLRN
jgi:pentatricopeptide repeat protein